MISDEEKTKLQMNIESELGEALSMQLNNTVGLVLDVRFCTWLCKQFGVMESKVRICIG
ncbi:MAG: hypothetical protein GY861_13680 [bacterium]|nr:hypothetical protein [bacterium]